MKTINLEKYSTKIEGMNAIKSFLIDNGFTVMQDSNKEYLSYTKDNKFACVSYSISPFMGLNLSSSYKGGKETGTGCQYKHETWEFSIDDFESALNYCFRGMHPKYYKDIKDFISNHYNAQNLRVITSKEDIKALTLLNGYYVFIAEQYAPVFRKNHNDLFNNYYERIDRKKAIFQLGKNISLNTINKNLNLFEDGEIMNSFKNRILGD